MTAQLQLINITIIIIIIIIITVFSESAIYYRLILTSQRQIR